MAKKSAINEENAELKNKIGGWSKGFSTLCLVLRIFLYIGIVCTAIGFVAFTVVMKDIKVEDNSIVIMDKKIEYKINEDKLLSLTIDGKKYDLKGKDVIKITNDSITNKNLDGLKKLVIVGLVVAIIIMVLTVIVLKKVGSLLKRMHDEEKVFIKDGHLVLITVMKLYIAMFVVSFIGSIIADIFSPTDVSTSINVSTIITILIVYFISLIYKYGESFED